MKGFFEIGDDYVEEQFIDFNKKKYVIIFNLASILIAFFIFFRFRIQSCPIFTINSIVFIAVGVFAFIFIHELIHGFFIWLFSKKKANYKFSLFYASAGAADRYFDKSAYIIIALAPVIFISLFLLLLINFISINYYNGILLVFALNVSGSIGDVYISLLTTTKEKDVLIKDEGESMHFFTKTPY